MRPLLALFAIPFLFLACGGGDDPDALPAAVPDVVLPEEAGGLPLPPGLEDARPPAADEAPPGPDLPESVDADQLVGFADGPVRVYVLGAGTSYGSPDFLGVVVTCAPDRVEATVAHGLFPPPGTPVRTTVEAPGRDVEVFGPSRYPSGPPAPHEALLEGADDVARLVGAAFVPGALVSNGYRTFRVVPDPDELSAFRADLLACPALDL